MEFIEKFQRLKQSHASLLARRNEPDPAFYNGIYTRYRDPVLTRAHVPLSWRFDLNEQTNPFFMERVMVNAVFNAGAIELDGKIVLVARVEGADRKSYFAVAESESGIDGFVFRREPVRLPAAHPEETNVYDMRLTKHEDGYIYGLFCRESKDASADDTSSAVACCGIVRTLDLTEWERLPDLETRQQQRNVVLHPEFVDGKYLLYTRPSDGFVDVGSGGGIGCALTESMENARAEEEIIIDRRVYHTVKEAKNGAGAPPIKTREGWLHIAHGVRSTAAGLRYVLYCFMTALDDPTRVIYAPGGYFLAPLGEERVGDVPNVVFSNGAVKRADGSILIYYASSDTRLHVAKTSEEQMLDYCKNTPPDGGTTHGSVANVFRLIKQNRCLPEISDCL